MKTKKLSFIFLSLITVFFFACNSSDSGQTEATEEATEEVVEEVTEEVTEEAEEAPLIALVVTHQVADYATWKASFDEHAAKRQNAQLEDWAIDVSKDDPNLVTVVAKVGDVEAAKAFGQSEELKQAMADAGVQGEPQISFEEMMFFDEEAARSSTVRGMINHTVANYDAWKAAFDEKASLQTDAGVSTVAVARNVDDPNNVTVVVTAADFETLEAFNASPELQEAMKTAGVTSEPVVNYMTVVFPEM